MTIRRDNRHSGLGSFAPLQCASTTDKTLSAFSRVCYWHRSCRMPEPPGSEWFWASLWPNPDCRQFRFSRRPTAAFSTFAETCERVHGEYQHRCHQWCVLQVPGCSFLDLTLATSSKKHCFSTKRTCPSSATVQHHDLRVEILALCTQFSSQSVATGQLIFTFFKMQGFFFYRQVKRLRPRFTWCWKRWYGCH